MSCLCHDTTFWEHSGPSASSSVLQSDWMIGQVIWISQNIIGQFLNELFTLKEICINLIGIIFFSPVCILYCIQCCIHTCTKMYYSFLLGWMEFLLAMTNLDILNMNESVNGQSFHCLIGVFWTCSMLRTDNVIHQHHTSFSSIIPNSSHSVRGKLSGLGPGSAEVSGRQALAFQWQTQAVRVCWLVNRRVRRQLEESGLLFLMLASWTGC